MTDSRCFDRNANVWYPCHEDHVTQHGPSVHVTCVCTRCGQITDVEACKRDAARGNQIARDALRKAGISYLSQDEKAAEAAFRNLPEEARRNLLARLNKAE
jgi:hypothetical protein